MLRILGLLLLLAGLVLSGCETPAESRVASPAEQLGTGITE